MMLLKPRAKARGNLELIARSPAATDLIAQGETLRNAIQDFASLKGQISVEFSREKLDDFLCESI
jgi:hypothetical protein